MIIKMKILIKIVIKLDSHLNSQAKKAPIPPILVKKLIKKAKNLIQIYSLPLFHKFLN